MPDKKKSNRRNELQRMRRRRDNYRKALKFCGRDFGKDSEPYRTFLEAGNAVLMSECFDEVMRIEGTRKDSSLYSFLMKQKAAVKVPVDGTPFSSIGIIPRRRNRKPLRKFTLQQFTPKIRTNIGQCGNISMCKSNLLKPSEPKGVFLKSGVEHA